MRTICIIVISLCSIIVHGQEFIDDSNFEEKINGKSAFDDDKSSIIIVEFWAEFNKSNAFTDWNKIQGVQYYRCDVAKAPSAKKKYKVRMAPTVIIFVDGLKESVFKAGLDLLLPADLSEIQEAVDEASKASQF